MGWRTHAFVFWPQKVQVVGTYSKTSCNLHWLTNFEIRTVVFFFKKYENCGLSFGVYLYTTFFSFILSATSFPACHLQEKVSYRQGEQKKWRDDRVSYKVSELLSSKSKIMFKDWGYSLPGIAYTHSYQLNETVWHTSFFFLWSDRPWGVPWYFGTNDTLQKYTTCTYVA